MKDILLKALENGIWFCGAVDGETKEVIEKCILHMYIFKINWEEKIIFAFCSRNETFDFQLGSINASISMLSFDDFNKRKLRGWALNKEDLL